MWVSLETHTNNNWQLWACTTFTLVSIDIINWHLLSINSLFNYFYYINNNESTIVKLKTSHSSLAHVSLYVGKPSLRFFPNHSSLILFALIKAMFASYELNLSKKILLSSMALDLIVLILDFPTFCLVRDKPSQTTRQTQEPFNPWTAQTVSSSGRKWMAMLQPWVTSEFGFSAVTVRNRPFVHPYPKVNQTSLGQNIEVASIYIWPNHQISVWLCNTLSNMSQIVNISKRFSTLLNCQVDP
jgi:hypothetical protein